MYVERRPSPDRSPEALEAQLRALPQPPVPADLEARLVAALPVRQPLRRRRWAVWAGVGGALAAACLLAVLAWQGRLGKSLDEHPGVPESAEREKKLPPETEFAPPLPETFGAALAARRTLDEATLPTFAWPIQETAPLRASTAIHSELFD